MMVCSNDTFLFQLCISILGGFNGCLGLITREIEFKIINQNFTGYEVDIFTCEKLAIQHGGFGCRLNVQNMTYSTVWCIGKSRDREWDPGYVYMVRKSVTITSPLTEVKNKWIYFDSVPICMTVGSVVGILFTPRTGWSTISIALINNDSQRPMKIFIQNTDTIVKFQSTVNDTIGNTKYGTGFPFLTDETYFLEIEVLEQSYKRVIYMSDGLMDVFMVAEVTEDVNCINPSENLEVYLNAALYYEYHVTIDDVVPARLKLSFINIVSSFHSVTFTAADT